MPSNTPKLGLYKYNPSTDGNQTFNVDTALNGNWDKIDTQVGSAKTDISTIKSDLSNTPPTSLSLKPGLQAVTVTRDTPLSVKGIKGRTLANLLGRDGNCESLTPFSFATGAANISTIALSTSDASVGVNGIRLTWSAANAGATYYRGRPITLEAGKRYIALLDVRTDGTGITGRLAVRRTTNWYGNIISTGRGTSYVAFVADGTESHIGIYANVNNLAGFVGFDAVRLFEISQAEYDSVVSMTTEQIVAKYPYVDDIKNVNGVYVRNATQNLFPPLSKWTNGRIYDGAYKFASTQVKGDYEVYAVNNGSASGMMSVKVKLLPNTTYMLSGVTDTYYVYDAYTLSGFANGRSSGTTFTTGAADEYYIGLYNRTATGPSITFKDVILTEGSTIVPFAPQAEQYVYYPDCQLASNLDSTVCDELYTDNTGQARATRRFKTMDLTGDLAWSFGGSVVSGTGYKGVQVPVTGKMDSAILSKYDGKILTYRATGAGFTGGDQQTLTADAFLFISIASADSGWGDSYTPTVDEIKAYFRGWQMGAYSSSFSTPYTGSGTKAWRPIIRDASDASFVTTVPANTYGSFSPYRLQYQLATQTDEPVRSEGAIMLAEGANTLEVGYGAVVRERARIAYSAGFGYEVNDTYWSTSLAYRTKDILNIYRDSIIDKSWARQSHGTPYGLVRATIPANSPITSAVYEVTYLALDAYLIGIPPTQISAEYPTNQRSVTDELVKEATQLVGRVSVLENGTAQAKQPQWITATTLLNGWVNYGVGYPVASYMKDALGFVHMRGLLKSGSVAQGVTLLTLPKGYRPESAVLFVPSTPVINTVSSPLPRLDVLVDGRIILNQVDNNWLDLSCVYFFVGN
ncbi:hypothetical protein SAMN05444162_3464 [Paenibacillaceae bacterium GAS479]|nr:hypothetical protein SAMN05444162_3464 [Paenibacillaceae bacterium GAS479]